VPYSISILARQTAFSETLLVKGTFAKMATGRRGGCAKNARARMDSAENSFHELADFKLAGFFSRAGRRKL
jgi:hypothetical protein